MKEIENLVDSGDFNTVIEDMMESLMSKDILYEPMKDLAEKVFLFFPSYFFIFLLFIFFFFFYFFFFNYFFFFFFFF